MGKIFDALEKAQKRTTRTKIAKAQVPKKRATVRVPKKRATVRVPNKRAAVQVKNEHLENKKAETVVPLVKISHAPIARHIDKTLVAYHDPESVEAELFKALKTNILFPSNGLPPQTILITSALPDDGKSFISANLAISIAQSVEEHVLLIDADIRKPDINSRFGFGKVHGLAEYLSRGENVGDVLLETQIEKLTILPAGTPPRNPSELLSSKKMKALIEEVKNRYDDRYIIIDSPPPSMASETNAIAKYVDVVILVVRAEKTPRAAVMETIDQIGKDKIIGIVFNSADQSSKQYYGYNKSYY